MKCRFCGTHLDLTLVDLGSAPPSNAYLSQQALHVPEKWFPLRVLVCESCWLVQTEDFAQTEELFDPEYAYFSGYSSTWLAHCERYVADMVERIGLGRGSHVVEIASNDGCLLQYFQRQNIPCLGIEPTASTAAAARAQGISVVQDFFGARLAHKLSSEGKQADLIVANNVLAHVPDINDFVGGITVLLKPAGIVTFEFPHLLRLLTESQFDTIYHEHFSYLSLTSVTKILTANGLIVFDVEELATHGGSLRVFAQHKNTGECLRSNRLLHLLQVEEEAGITTVKFYAGFQQKAEKIKDDLLIFLINLKLSGKKIVAYGAAAKGNTLLNFAGIRHDLISLVVDRNPAKQNKYLPGSRIPIVDEAHLRRIRPDFILILPWNLRDEVKKQLEYVRDWGCEFIIAIPEISHVN